MKQLLTLLLAINLYAIDFDSTVERIKHYEGFSSAIYKDAGGYSIGYGTNLSSITKAEAHLLLVHRLSIRLAKLQQYTWFNRLNRTRQEVIVGMSYQLGMTGLLKFKHMIWRLEHGYWRAAANAMQESKWFKQSGNRSRELVKQMKRGW